MSPCRETEKPHPKEEENKKEKESVLSLLLLIVMPPSVIKRNQTCWVISHMVAVAYNFRLLVLFENEYTKVMENDRYNT